MEHPVQRIAEGVGIDLRKDGLRDLPKRLERKATP
jgi:GTP cyclohydrolase I